MSEAHTPATTATLPAVLVGPILRRVTPEEITIWCLTTRPLEFALQLKSTQSTLLDRPLHPDECWSLQVGERAWVCLLHVTTDQALPQGERIEYDLRTRIDGQGWCSLTEWGPELLYPGERLPGFVLQPRLTSILHGSCRKPHHPSKDGLARADAWVERHLDVPEQLPAALMLSGDQLYADDVAGPMLRAAHCLSDRLGLWDEQLPGDVVANGVALRQSPHCYYEREQLLPKDPLSEDVRERFFAGVRKPIFTSDSAHNHLITFAEVIASYCLVWSPLAWQNLKLTAPPLSPGHAALYDSEDEAVSGFRAQLPQVRRVMAHLPTYMIFDDHDVTDDWNLSAAWEMSAYGHPFSRQIIGNALIGYLLCQGSGNDPRKIRKHLGEHVESWLDSQAPDDQQTLIGELIAFQRWDYLIPIDPGVLVLDTRTRRWRAERNLRSPSGLMDWEALTELQQQLLDRKAVILVSPAPIFGVKLIETIQKAFTAFGQPLMVDAENWMSHPGAANVMLNIFRHTRTPEHFVILSGDVHYSFVYDIEIRFRKGSPKIWQITSSGLKNEFPHRLLKIFDRLNRWLYAPSSPLNWFTRRRLMRVSPRRPEGAAEGCRLVNNAGIGLVRFAADGEPEEVWQLGADGHDVRFDLSDEEEHWG
ncbi:alkaline phosphatase D family protein [Marinobacterium weihaiense]|uniref:Alkaline phosphatase family protein n=1 Tax=Marinobacterium weihaiense TaxID=2851016 RepID=A0ABS6MF95_9GAMM|nr:alkaline phosphatase D family protein [Marinobacterium weihaiense]MBV0934397.1 alkaline phosphatase family protein [Marinobacterium weihaiense]